MGQNTAKNVASSLESHVGYWMRLVSNHTSHAFQAKVESRGVTVAEWVLMRAMLEVGAIYPSGLAERVGLSRGAVSKLIDRLIAKRLVRSATDKDDRRYQTVELTGAGRRLVPRLAAMADENDAAIFGHLQSEQREELISLMRGVASRHGWTGAPVD